jgi:16S rRNA processing protein RimM
VARPPGAFLAVGRIRRPHGVHGEVIVEITTDFPERLVPGTEVGLGTGEPERFLTVDRVRVHKGSWLLSFAGIHRREAVEGWREQWLFLPEQERSLLPANYYYEHELIGLACVLGDGKELGRVFGLLPGAGGSLLQVDAEGSEVLVPFLSPIVVRVDLPAGVVVLDPPAGLFETDAV